MSDSKSEFVQKLKEVLLKPQSNIKPVPLLVEHPRYSFDTSVELQQTIDEKLKASGKKLLRDPVVNMNETAENESFLTLEQICNKSASDPESTLFEYIHSDHKDEVIANAMQRLSHAEQQSCEEAENTHDFCKQYLATHQLEDLTQLDNIEAPSKLWDNTVQTFAASPVKMVGLLRPSTILEESERMCNSESLSTRAYSVATSYATAADCTSSTQAKTEPYYSLQDTGLEERAEELAEDTNRSLDEVATKLEESMSLLEEEKNDDISLKHLSAELDMPTNNEISLNDSVIEIISDDEDDQEEEDKENKHTELNVTDSLLNISGMTYSAEEKVDEQSPISFNDTLEEVDYLMRKGMELRMAQQQKQQTDDNKNSPKHVLPLKQNNMSHVLSPKCDNLPKAQKKPATSAKKLTTPIINLAKPLPKFEFKIPMGSASKKTPSHKLPTPKKFDHIVSPISMYVKHGSNAPLMTKIMSKTGENDWQNSSIFRNVKPQKFFKENEKEHKNADSSFVFPKKEYISSELKQMLDERSAMTVPGGKKIQQYVEPAMSATVIKHNGQVHLNAVQRELFKTNSNDSLNDLSIRSGDVSLWTMKDAKKY